MSTYNLCFEQEYEKYQSLVLSEKFQFLKVKFSIYLNRCVFIMICSQWEQILSFKDRPKF